MDPLKRILVVDDNPEERALAALLLRRQLADAEVVEVTGAAAFAAALAQGRLAAVVTEAALPWSDGLCVLDAVKQVFPACAVVFLTSGGGEQLAGDAMRRGLDGYVVKGPRGWVVLAGAVEDAMGRAAGRWAPSSRGSGYRTVLDALPVGIFTTTAAGVVLDATPAVARALGASDRTALAGADLFELLDDEDRRRQVRERLASGQAVRDLDARVRRRDGDVAWLRINAWPVPAEGGGEGRYEGTLEDISGYKRVEKELSERAAALVQSNAELQQFAYVISHDLQEPLHLIERYTRMVSERYADELDDEGQRFMEHVLSSAERMQTMIDDVLEYARVDTRGREFEEVAFEDVVDEALKNLKAAVEDTEASVTRHGLPTLPADGAQMVQLFQNLIGNALKFHGEEPPAVQVSAVEGETEWVFAVMDNGIGIEAEQLERIFGMFQRLHSAEEVPGTGIGLAICKRIVERHGGQIWATSESGKGSTFYFTLPKAATAPAGEPGGGTGEA